jgi:type IX secretion system substrate protein/cellulase (glycosyl hydrolase family 5)
MKLLSKIIFYSILLLISIHSFAQYVTLNGRQFKDANGNDFYPVCMNYGVQIFYDPSTTTYFIGPNDKYGINNGSLSCTNPGDCIDLIYTDFLNIASMGFNTVHVFGLSPDTKSSSNTDLFNIKYVDSNSPWITPEYNLSPFNPSDFMVQNLLGFVKEVIQKASDAGLKVIIDGTTAEGYSFTNAENEIASYLGALANEIHNNSNADVRNALMAYILAGEPLYGDGQLTHTKQEICQLTSQFYDSLKVNDADHLIGSGGILGAPGIFLQELFEWDPAVTKMDFYFPHFYPEFREYEQIIPTAHNYNAMMDRIYAIIYWLGNNCPVPWMVGETGFSADITFSNASIHGDYTQQQDYYQQLLEQVRNCGGSGCSAWQYQEVAWDNPPSQLQERFGLLKHGDRADYATFLTLQKPAVAEFQGYLNAQGRPPAVVPPTQPPSDYYDPAHNGFYLNLNCPSCIVAPVTGTVTDQYNNEIKDAILIAHTFIKFDHDEYFNNNLLIPIDNVSYSFTQPDGSFTLTPFDPEHPSDPSRQYIRWLEISSIGSANSPAAYPYNCWGCFTQNYFALPPTVGNNITCSLDKVSLNLNEVIQNQTVNAANSPKIFAAWRTLTVSTSNTVESGYTADFKAMDEVHVESEFHAESGSEVHIYNEASLPDCDDISGFRISNNPSSSPHVEPGNKSMELIFRKKNLPASVSVYPNPNAGKFLVNYSGNTGELKQLKVYDIIGNCIINSNFTVNEAELNLTNQSKGIYFLELKSATKIFNQKIIIQ